MRGRAIAAANAAWRGWAAASAFERAAALSRVADLIEERRDDLALHADARPGQAAARRVVWRGRGARRLLAHGGGGRDAARRLDASVDRRLEAHPRLPRPARRRRRHHALELAVHDAGRADRARARRRQCGRLGSCVRRPRCAAVKLAECIVDAELPAGVFSMVTGPGRRRRRRGRIASQASHGIGLHRLRSRRACTSQLGRPARRRCSSSEGTARWSSSTTPMSPLPPRRASPRRSCAPGRAARRASCFLVHESVHDEFVERLRGRGRALGPSSATRSPRRRRWAR